MGASTSHLDSSRPRNLSQNKLASVLIIPLPPSPPLSLILANDLLPTACTSITRNIEYNDVQAIPYEFLMDGVSPNDGPAARGKNRRKFKRGGVVVNQGDAK